MAPSINNDVQYYFDEQPSSNEVSQNLCAKMFFNKTRARKSFKYWKKIVFSNTAYTVGRYLKKIKILLSYKLWWNM